MTAGSWREEEGVEGAGDDGYDIYQGTDSMVGLGGGCKWGRQWIGTQCTLAMAPTRALAAWWAGPCESM